MHTPREAHSPLKIVIVSSLDIITDRIAKLIGDIVKDGNYILSICHSEHDVATIESAVGIDLLITSMVVEWYGSFGEKNNVGYSGSLWNRIDLIDVQDEADGDIPKRAGLRIRKNLKPKNTIFVNSLPLNCYEASGTDLRTYVQVTPEEHAREHIVGSSTELDEGIFRQKVELILRALGK